MKKNFKLVDQYIGKLSRALKSNSQMNTWNHILQGFRWFNIYCDMNSRRGKIYECFEHHMARIRKALAKARNKDAMQNTAENLVKNGRMPEGGLQELGKYVSSELPWALSLKKADFLNPRIYNYFMGWLYSSFYMSVQGRVGGIQDMRVGQAHTLMERNGIEFSQNFKTSNHHSLQAVSIGEIAAKGLQIYVTLARPVIVGDNTALDLDEAFLFLTSNAKPEYMAGSRVTQFYSVITGGKLHICTTVIRAMMETESDNLWEKGLITMQQKSSVQRLGGHSGATVQKHYIKKNLHNSVTDAREVMNIVYNSGDTTVHAPATPVPTTVTTVTSSCATDREHDRFYGMDIGFTGDIFEDINDAYYVDNRQTHDEGGMYWCDNGITSSSSSSSSAAGVSVVTGDFISKNTLQSSSSSSSSAAAAAVGVVATNDFFPNNGNPHSFSSFSSTSSSSSSSAGVGVANGDFISKNTMQSSNARGGAPLPLPLPVCRIGQLQKARRVMWSDYEIGKVCEIYNVLNDELLDEEKRYMTRHVFRRLLEDAEAVSQFHPAHLSPEKLRHAIRKYTSNSHTTSYMYDVDL